MAKCPKCKVEIGELGYSEYSQRVMDFGVDENGRLYYDNIENLDSFLKPEWYCRVCNCTICKSENKAIKFLKG